MLIAIQCSLGFHFHSFILGMQTRTNNNKTAPINISLETEEYTLPNNGMPNLSTINELITFLKRMVNSITVTKI